MSENISRVPTDESETLLDYQVAQNAYPAKYLIGVCRKIGIKDRWQKRLFVRGIRHVGKRYISLKRSNQTRLQPHKQEKILDEYRDALRLAQIKFSQIQTSTAASGKLGKAVRKKYSETTDPGMKDMFKPYCDDTGMAITLFEKFLGVLADAAEDAKSQDVGNDKADISGLLLAGWVAGIGKMWPNDVPITFALGKRDDELNIYTSPSILIIHDIVHRLEPDITPKDIETTLRTVKKENMVNQPLAIFLLG